MYRDYNWGFFYAFLCTLHYFSSVLCLLSCVRGVTNVMRLSPQQLRVQTHQLEDATLLPHMKQNLSMLFLKCGAFWSAHEGWEPGFMASLETPNDLLFCTNRRIDRCLTTDRCFTYESLSDRTLISGDGQFHSITNGFCSFQMLRSVAILRLWIRSAMNSFVLSTISQWQEVTACFILHFPFLDCFNLHRFYMQKSMQK